MDQGDDCNCAEGNKIGRVFQQKCNQLGKVKTQEGEKILGEEI